MTVLHSKGGTGRSFVHFLAHVHTRLLRRLQGGGAQRARGLVLMPC
jgi:hypothetical protein